MKKRFDPQNHVEEKAEGTPLTTSDLVNCGDDPAPAQRRRSAYATGTITNYNFLDTIEDQVDRSAALIKKDILDNVAKVMGYVPGETEESEPDDDIWSTQRTGDEIIDDAVINQSELEKRAIALGAAVTVFDDHEYNLGEFLPSDVYSAIENEAVTNKRELAVNQLMQQEMERHRKVMKELRLALEVI